jgi:NADPH-dependent glutamate synthase beta subunit-like oxidoreductase
MKKHEHVDVSKDKNIDKDIILDDLRFNFHAVFVVIGYWVDL